ncbi:hypothetical protein JCM19000A_12730 [Silvimonas sp. JCM 19000]
MQFLDEPANAQWQHYLSQQRLTAAEAVAAFKAAQARAGEPLQNIVFPPPLFTRSTISALAQASTELVRILMSLPERIFGGDIAAMLAFQGIPAAEARFIQHFCSPKLLNAARAFARPDFLLTEAGFSAVEINVGSALGGIGFCDGIAAGFLADQYHQHLTAQNVQCRAAPMLQTWLAAIRALLPTAVANKAAPLFFEAMVDPQDLQSPLLGHAYLVKSLREHGFAYANGLAQDLTFREDGVFYGDRQVDIVYGMFTYAEMRALHVAPDFLYRLAEADAKQQVAMIAPPANMLFDNKANLELLSASQFADYYSPAERALLARLVPATFRLHEASMQRALAQRDAWVLKPAADYGGAAVTIGANVTDLAWLQILHAALVSGSPYVLQEKIPTLWSYASAAHAAGQRFFVCLGPMVFGGQYGGALLRQTPLTPHIPVINVRQGASAGVALATG